MIKVCGITRAEDGDLSLAAGATALGFNFFPGSPRYLPPRQAAPLLKAFQGRTLRVGLFVVSSLDPDWKSSLAEVRNDLDAVQLHGLDPADPVPDTGLRTLVAASPQNATAFAGAEIVIDTSWGRGQLADWDKLAGVSVPFILSGGLDPDNVSEALRRLRPAGVDVCSGVEQRPGRKSARKLEAFLSLASRHYDSREQSS